MTSLADDVACLVLETYNSLPKVGKPSVRTNGLAEWTMIAGLVIKREDSKVAQAHGLALHDSHAEILAIRGFNRFLLDEVIKLQSDESYQSNWLKRHSPADQLVTSFSLLATSIFLFVSGTPCGDASLDLLAEDPLNTVPWTTPSGSEDPGCFRGHEYIWERGKVRFKPGIIILYRTTYFQGRGDSPRTLSKSCSDKLALASCTSILNSLLSSIIDPSSCYLDYLIVPQSAYHEAGFHRAFVERLKSIPHDTWPHRFRIQPIQTLTTNYLIPPSLTPPKSISQKALPTALTSVIYVKSRPTEVMQGGVRMGSQFPPSGRGASYLCRARMGQDFFDFIQHDTPRMEMPLECTYAELKRKAAKGTEPIKRSVRESFGGWTSNDSDVDFTLVASHRLGDGS